MEEESKVSLVVDVMIGVAIFVVLGVLLFISYKTYKSVYKEELDNSAIERSYIDQINNSGDSVEDFIMSPMLKDYCLLTYANDTDLGIVKKLNIIKNTSRGYRSWDKSYAALSELCEDEGMSVLSSPTLDDINDLLGDDLVEDDSTFKGANIMGVLKLPSKLDNSVTNSEDCFYIRGRYYRSGSAIKFMFEDGVHELVYFVGRYPDSNTVWEECDGIVRVPLEKYLYVSTSTNEIDGLFDVSTCKISQIVYLGLESEGEESIDECSYYILAPYSIAVRNSKTDTLIAGGKFYNEEG